MTTTNWAVAADVLSITGVTVTDAQVLTAQFIIEIFADISPDASFDSNLGGIATGLISQKNLRYLKFAVCYQAAWMLAHPDTFTNVDATNMSQDGVSFTHSNINAGVLAPLAKRCVDRLTWRRPNRSIRIAKRLDPSFQYNFGSRDSAPADDARDWTPS